MAADAFIQFRVTQAVKMRLQAVADREQVPVSTVARQLIETMLRSQVPFDPPSAETIDQPSRDARLSIRLDPEDRALLTSRSAARGMRSATYVSVLVRAHLRNVTPLPGEELAALKRSIAELRALGHNLNQMATAIHQGGNQAPGHAELGAMLKIAEGLRDHFKSLLIANMKSWEQGHAEASD
jgi:antitoxin component of RelBE/YafQ-DinJ toxin-antitoxin module